MFPQDELQFLDCSLTVYSFTRQGAGYKTHHETETERAKLWGFREWFSLTNHESNTQQPLWPLTVPGNQKSTSQGLEAPPSQPCKEERQRRADPATSEHNIIVNCNLHSLSGFAARQGRNLIPVHGAWMRIAHQK